MSHASAVLQLSLTRGLGPRTLGRLLDALASNDRSAETIVEASLEELIAEFGLRSDVAEGIPEAAEQAASLAEALETQNIHCLIKHSDGYPSCLVEVLGNRAPPLLYAAGNLAVLARPGVAFSGSRQSSDAGLKTTHATARTVAQAGINVISGYAPGADTAAHAAALEAGGVTTLVLAEGILSFRPRKDLHELMTEENVLVLSEFAPKAAWAVHQAMQRNQTICALARAVVLIEAGLEGGTSNAGKTAQELGVPLFALDYPDPPPNAAGNRQFLKSGALSLSVDKDGNIDSSIIIDAAASRPAATGKSNSLFPDWEPELTPKRPRKRARR